MPILSLNEKIYFTYWEYFANNRLQYTRPKETIMSKILKTLVMLTLTIIASYSVAHSGRTDSNGGHNCSQASQEKGLCYGYHYHNSISKVAPSTNAESVSGSAIPLKYLEVDTSKLHDQKSEDSHKHPTS